MNTQIAGIVYGFDGSIIQEYEAKLAEAVANHKTAQKMLKTKLEQLDIIDAAINTAQDQLDDKIVEAQNESDLDKFKSIVGFDTDEPNKDLSVTLWEMHNQLTLELNGDSENADDYENSDQIWRKDGLKKYVADTAQEVKAREKEILLYIQQLLGASGSISLKDDGGNDSMQINKLIKKLNKLLVKYGLKEFDPSTVEFDYDEPAEDFTGSEDHDHDEDIPESSISEDTTFVEDGDVEDGGDDETQEPEPEPQEPEKSELERVTEALSEGGEVEIVAALEVEEPLKITVPGTVLTINDNVTSSKNAIVVSADATLKGNGNVTAGRGGDYSAVVVNNGSLNIEGGNYGVGSDANGQGNSCIYVINDGKLRISGGQFETEAMWNNRYWTINLNNSLKDVEGVIEITGGIFVGQDPANPESDDKSNYVADGYESVKLENQINGKDAWEVKQREVL